MVNNVHWTRGELKRRSKAVLHLHYWRIVLVTFLFAFFIGSGTIVSETIQPILEEISAELGDSSSQKEDSYQDDGANDELESEVELGAVSGVVFLGVIFIAIVVLMFVIIAGALIVEILVVNPLDVGAKRFYIRSFDTKPQFKELFFAFENRYKNIVAVMLLRDLYTIFWTLLFIIPGIIKAYEYTMIPYLLAENPNLEAKEAFAISKQMMKGHKWNAFVLDLSFLGWQILSIITLGILGIFYVDSYVYLTGAALYRKLKGVDQIPENIYYDGMEYDVEQGWYGTTEGGVNHGVSDFSGRR